MKNFKCWITMFILLIFASCGEDNPVNDNVKPDVPQTEPDKIEFANAADKNLAFDCIESSKEIKFKTNVAWKIMVPSDVESWLSVNPSSGTKGDASVSIAAKGNEEYEGRSAELTLVAGSKKEKISVFQIQKDAIVIASPNYEIAAEGGEILIEIGHNVDFDISIEADWLKQSTTKAFVKESLRFVASENTTKEARDGKIVFSNKEKSITQTVNVHQAKRENLEREALIALYKATNGDNWVHNENWCSEKPLSEWYGVKTNQEFSGVYVLDLAKNNLTGALPAELSNLKKLSFGQFSNNKLTNISAVDFSQFSELSFLNFEENKIEGALPESVNLLKKLKFLGLGRNLFSGTIPSSYVNLTGLTYFSVRENRLTGQYPFFMKEMGNWETVIKKGLEPQLPGFGFTSEATRKMIALGEDLYLDEKGMAIELRWGKAEVLNKQIIQNKIKYLYTKFKDEVDFFQVLYNVPTIHHLNVNIAGSFSPINNEGIENIGLNPINWSAQYGSNNKLKGIMTTYSYNNIGVILHELCHYWGAIDLGQETIDANGKTSIGHPHWGIADINGLLGGFKGETLKRNVDGNPKKYQASSPDGGADDSFFPVQMSSHTYAPIELYLMGMASADEVPVMTFFKGVSGTKKDNPYTNGVFYAEEEVKVTMDDVIQKYGKRKPAYPESQKDFRFMTIIVTANQVTDREWEIIDRSLQSLESTSASEKNSFYRATQSRGSLKFSNIKELLK